MRPALKAVVGGVLIVVLVAVQSANRAGIAEEPVANTNTLVAVSNLAEVLQPGDRACTPVVTVPVETRAVRIYPGFDAGRVGPRVTLTVQRAAGRPVVGRTSARGYPREQPLIVPLRVPREVPNGLVCLTNRGTKAVSFAAGLDGPSSFGGRPVVPVRFDMLSSTEREPRWTQAGTAVERASLFKSRAVGRPVVVAALLAPFLLGLMALLLVVRSVGGRR